MMMAGYNGSYKFLFLFLIFVVCSSFCGYLYSNSNNTQLNEIFRQATKDDLWKKLNFLHSDYLNEKKEVQGFWQKINQQLSEVMQWKEDNFQTKANRPTQTTSWQTTSNKTGLILFTTWIDSAEKDLVHNNVIRTWRKWKPLIKPLFFYSDISTEKKIEKEGWLTAPVSKTGCGEAKMPTVRDMFLDAIKQYDSDLYGYANGDITFDDGMPLAIAEIVKSDIIREKPVLVLIRRTNVDFSKGTKLDETSDISEMYAKGKIMKDGSSDGFFTNSLFPWKYVPDVVVGRIGIGMWLVSYARAMNVTVIDITRTVKAIHMTTKSGNLESHFKQNARCNHKIYGDMNLAPTSWGCGFITCASIDIMFDKKGDTAIRYKNPKNMDKKCGQCSMDLRKILPKSFGIQGRTYFGQKIKKK